MKFLSQYLQYLQSYVEIFISHLAAVETLLESNNISLRFTGLSIYYPDMTCIDGLYLKQSRSDCRILRQNIKRLSPSIT